MRLLFFSNVYPNPLAPTKGTFNRALVEALAREHEVEVVSPISWVDELQARRRGQGSVPRHLNIAPNWGVSHPRFYYPPKILRQHYGHWMHLSVRHELARLGREFRPEAVVSYWAHPDGEVALRAARAWNVPAIAMVGGSDVLLLARHGSRRRAILNVLSAADAVVAVSDDLAAQVRSQGIDGSKVHVIRRGVDRQAFSPGDQQAARGRLGLPNQGKVLIAVGRLEEVKGFDVLIAGCRLLRDRGVPFACYVLGAGSLREKLARQIDEADLRARVVLRGAVPQSQLPDWYRAADLTVLTSHSEGVPNVLLESLSCGTPFVATRVGGVPEIADPVGHRLVPPGDAFALAAAVNGRLANAPAADWQPRFMPGSWRDSADALVQVIEAARGRRAFGRRPSIEAERAPMHSPCPSVARVRELETAQ